MKRYILIIMCCIATIMAQNLYADCITLTNSSVNISRWGAQYAPVDDELECWIVDLTVDGPVQITYNISLEMVSGSDQVTIYELDENNQTTVLRSFSSTIETGVLVTTANRLKVEYWGFVGNMNGVYDGFQLHFSAATQEHVINHDYYILGSLGIGTTQPKGTLHVNGPIYGGESSGAIKLKSNSGYVTIGTATGQLKKMFFTTDRNQFIFNKSILTQEGVFGSTANTIQFSTNDTARMVIVNNNVGIGILNPTTRLHVNGGALKIGNTASSSDRLKNFLQFGDGSYVQIGELEKDDYLTFKATGYNFTKGNVGIGTISPAYKLDVVGLVRTNGMIVNGTVNAIGTVHADSIIADRTIRAEEIIVETSGADFVFAEDYQLRPLSEVKAFIEENKHLPEIKSAQEMQENGVGVNELQTQLLQKIEELTLYLIQQEQTIQELRQKLEQLEK